MNPHSQRLQVAAHKQVRQLLLPKGKAKSKAKNKAAAKQKAKAKAKAAPKKKTAAEAGGQAKTAYAKAKADYFQWPLGYNSTYARCELLALVG